MKALLLKDYMWLKKPLLNMALVWIVMQAIFIYFSKSGSNSILGIYLYFVSTLGISTISIDEKNNGLAYLFTLPRIKENYVFEKYLITTLISIVFFIYGYVTQLILCNLNGVVLDYTSKVMICAICLSVFVSNSLYLLILLNFGLSKNNLVKFLPIAFFLAFNIFSGIITFIIGEKFMLVVMVSIAIIFTIISFKISENNMKKLDLQ